MMKRVASTLTLLACAGLPHLAGAQTAAYFASSGTPVGSAANNPGLNIGHKFTVTSTNIQIQSLGVFDYGANGLNQAHTVTLFSNQTALASLTVPAGTNAPLVRYFRYAALPSPLTLQPGTYAVVAYQMNGATGNSDSYGDAGSPRQNGFNGTFNLIDNNTIFEFTTSGTAYPGTGGGSLGTAGENLPSASFAYTDLSNPTVAYTADPIQTAFGGAANNSGLNIGHKFVVSGAGITIYHLGVFDYQGNGLGAAHTVTLFDDSGNSHNAIDGGSVVVPAGTAAPLANGFRFSPLAQPIKLPAGSYSVIAYQMNGNSASDGYGENNVSGFNGGGNVSDLPYTSYQFTTAGSPSYPDTGTANNLASASFTYSNVIAPPIIVLQPPSTLTVYAGASPKLSVLATGSPTISGYQWYLNNSAIAGATNSSWTVANVQPGDSGKTYRCTILSDGGSTSTAPATLAVIAAPTAAYPTAVLADQPISYWRLDEGPDDAAGNNGRLAADCVGGNAGAYTNALLSQAGCCAKDSDTAAVFGSVNFANSYVGGIGGIDFATAGSAVFSVEAWVNGAMSYYSGAGIVSKSTASTVEQFCLDTGGAKDAFRFFVRDASGGAHAIEGTNSVDGVWHHLVGVCDQTNGVLRLYVDGMLQATGTIAPGSGILSVTAPTLIGSRRSSATGDADWQFFGTIDEVAIYPKALTASQVVAHYNAADMAPRIVQQPTNLTTNEGASATFSALITGTPPLVCQWYDVTAGAPGTALKDETNSSLTLKNIKASQNGNLYMLTVDNADGSASSSSAQLTVISGPPSFRQDVPSTTLAYAGRSISISAGLDGTLPINYQWMINGTNLTDSTWVQGAHSNVLTLLSVPASLSGAHYQLSAGNLNGGPVLSSVGAFQVVTAATFNQGSGWSLNGSSVLPVFNNNTLTLTDGGGSEAMSSFFCFPLYIGSFKASFVYRDVSGAGGADGVAFVLHNAPKGTAALGGAGGALGYAGITPSFALLLNIYGGGVGMALGTNGVRAGSYGSLGPVKLTDGNPILITVSYQQGQLGVLFQDQTTAASYSTNLAVGDLSALLGSATAYVGFSGADGALVSTQTVSDFQFLPLPTLALQKGAATTVSWPAATGGYILQSTTDLQSGVWTPVTLPISQVNGMNQAVIPVDGTRFFRLGLSLP
jgi:hypothetical protein